MAKQVLAERRTLTVTLLHRRLVPLPSHVPWTGGVMGQRIDLSVKWETGLEGTRIGCNRVRGKSC